MENFYGLTKTQMELMELFWNTTSSLSFKELLTYANETLGKNWKKQTLSTFLTGLQSVGLIGTDSSQYHYRYFALCTKEEHIHNWTRMLIQNSFDNSIENFFAAFSGGKKLSKEEAEQLDKLV